MDKMSYSMSRIPYVTYEVLDEYAESFIASFVPEQLESPGKLNVEAFVDTFLGLSLKYRKICYNHNVLAMIAFSGGFIQVMNKQTGLAEPVLVSAGTVIVDTSLINKRNLARLRFTLMHEASHRLLHRAAFSEDNPFATPGVYENQYLAAKEGRIDYNRSQKRRTDNEIIERQADFFASALIMPRPAMRTAFKDYFKHHNEKPHRIIFGVNPMDDTHAKLLPEYIAYTFEVSKRAALIRLEKLIAIVDRSWRHMY